MTYLDKRHVTVNDAQIAYVESGTGDPIVFLHGNPTSSYLWRHVMPEVTGQGRCLAPDLIGMGDSDKLPDSGPGTYTFAQHRHYLDGWLDGVRATTNVTLVGHDWGAALAFDWARRHPDAVRGIAYMEAPVAPGRWADLPPQAAELFRALRSPAGEQMILEQNMFVEQILPAGVLEPLSEQTMAEYRRPYLAAGENRRPTLTWPRQIPLDGDPPDVTHTMQQYADWLASSPLPKLFINADPGQVLTGPARDLCRSWPNQTEVTVPGRHFIQEDSGPQIGQAIARWLEQLIEA
ncbi:MAG: haloalkane dehalogenase [Solirubrobacteraceae bacterium]